MPSEYQHSITFRQWVNREIFEKKMISPIGFIVFLFIAAGVGYSFADKDLFLIPFIAIGVVLGIIVIYICLFKPLTGFYLVNTLAFLAFYPEHITGIKLPLSTGVEVLMVFIFIGSYMYTKRTAAPRGGLITTPISIALLIYMAYLACEVFNPNINNNIDGWLFVFKRLIVYIFCYVAAYDLIDTPDKFRYFLKYWVVFSFAAGLYGCYQQWVGYLPMEMHYILKDPQEFKLLFQGGSLRKFSFLSDVVAFGILAGSMAVFTLLMALNEKNKKRRYIFWVFTVILVLGMLYSGTRTTYIMLPAGIAIYALMTIRSKKTLVILFCSFITVFFVMFAPIDTPVLNRLRSTFNSKEESLNVRDINRHYIQPYIYAHPMGGGIATSGVDGKRFYPTHPLAGFPPDSGFLKILLEQGWIGFALYVLYNIIILYQGIHYYFRMQNAEYKKYMAVIVAALFSIIVTQYAQVSIGQIPQALFIFSSISLMKRLLEFDQQKVREGKVVEAR